MAHRLRLAASGCRPAVARSSRRFSSVRPPPPAENGIVDAIGNTPLIRVNSLSNLTGRNIYAKAEFQNPGGSVKDRAALSIVAAAEKSGRLRPGGTVVEGTAGNTGIGLAHVCRAKGYSLVIYMPDTQSQGKIDLLRLLGADVRPVPAVPFDDPDNYNHQARRQAQSMANAVWTDQFDNIANRQAHLDTTGPEIWSQLDGRIDGFVCGTGTGGTLAGITRALKDRSSGAVGCFLADPPGSVLHSVVTSRGRRIERTGLSSITEGIGQGRVTANLRPELEELDGSVHVPDERSVEMVYRVLEADGLYLGASSGLNLAAAVDISSRFEPGSNLVTILCDGAYRYADRLFSRAWLEQKGLYRAVPEHCRRLVVLP